MSFGLKPPTPGDKDFIKALKDIEDAIFTEASEKILFATAANHGSHGPRTLPANCRDVICIHTSDGKGKDGGKPSLTLGCFNTTSSVIYSVPTNSELGNNIYVAMDQGVMHRNASGRLHSN
jgi:hypothetical protein